MEKLLEKIKNANLPKWAEVTILALMATAAMIVAIIGLTSCTVVHSVTQSASKKGDSIVIMRYEQTGKGMR